MVSLFFCIKTVLWRRRAWPRDPDNMEQTYGNDESLPYIHIVTNIVGRRIYPHREHDKQPLSHLMVPVPLAQGSLTHKRKKPSPCVRGGGAAKPSRRGCSLYAQWEFSISFYRTKPQALHHTTLLLFFFDIHTKVGYNDIC